MGLVEVLTIVFVVLKLLGIIAWSWWAVFAPLLVAVGIYVIILAIYALVLFAGVRKAKRLFNDLDK